MKDKIKSGEHLLALGVSVMIKLDKNQIIEYVELFREDWAQKAIDELNEISQHEIERIKRKVNSRLDRYPGESVDIMRTVHENPIIKAANHQIKAIMSFDKPRLMIYQPPKDAE